MLKHGETALQDTVLSACCFQEQTEQLAVLIKLILAWEWGKLRALGAGRLAVTQLERRLSRNRFPLPCLPHARTPRLYLRRGLEMLLKFVRQAAWLTLAGFSCRKLTASKRGYLRCRFAPQQKSRALQLLLCLPLRCMAGRHREPGKSWGNNSCLQGLENRGKRTGFGQSERNVRFFSTLFGGNEKNPNVLFGVNPNRILNVMFCFEVSCPSCFSHSFISGLF